MTDSDRAILAELNTDAAASMAAWPSVECGLCGMLILGDYGDLDGHLLWEHGIEAEEGKAA